MVDEVKGIESGKEETPPTEAEVKAAERNLDTVNTELGAVEAKAQAGGLSLDGLMALSKEATKLRSEREKLAGAAEAGVREEVTALLGKVKFVIPKDAMVRVAFKRDGDNLIINTVSIVSPTLADAVYEAIGVDTLDMAEKVSSIKGFVIEGGEVTLNANTGTPKAATGAKGGGGGSGAETMTVDGVEYSSAGEAYRKVMGVEKLPYAMNRKSIASALSNEKNGGHTVA